MAGLGIRFFFIITTLFSFRVQATPLSAFCNEWLAVLGMQSFLVEHRGAGKRIPKRYRKALNAEVRERLKRLEKEGLPIAEVADAKGPEISPQLEHPAIPVEDEPFFSEEALFQRFEEVVRAQFPYLVPKDITSGLRHHISAERLVYSPRPGQEMTQVTLGGLMDANSQVLAITLWQADAGEFQNQSHLDLQSLLHTARILSVSAGNIRVMLAEMDLNQPETLVHRDQVILWDILQNVSRYHMGVDIHFLKNRLLQTLPPTTDTLPFSLFLHKFLVQESEVYAVTNMKSLRYFLRSQTEE